MFLPCLLSTLLDPQASISVDQASAPIIVTARPSSLEPGEAVGETILTQTVLGNRGIASLADLAGLEPSLVAEPNGVMGNSQPTLRGLYSPVGAAPVGLAINDIPLAIRPSAFVSTADIQFFDIDRVEISRGSQVASGGPGAMAGSIRWRSVAPTFDRATAAASVQGSTIAHGGKNYRATVAAGGPIVGDSVAIRLAAMVDSNGGYIDRLGLSPERELNRRFTYAVRASLTARSGANWTIRSSVFLQQDHRRDLPIFGEGLGGLSQNFVRAQPGTDRILGAGVVVSHEGGIRVDASSSMLIRHANQTVDYSQTFGELVLGGVVPSLVTPGGSISRVDTRQRNLAQEIRLSSPWTNISLDWTAGVRVSRSILSLEQKVSEPGIADLAQTYLGGSIMDVFGVGLIDGEDSYRTSEHDTETEIAVFSGIGWRPVSSLRLGAEFRAIRSQVTLSVGSAGPFAGTATPDVSFVRSVSTYLVPKLSAYWQVAPLHRIAITLSRGFRPGGGNTPVPTTLCAIDLAALGRASAPATFAGDNTTNLDLEYRYAESNGLALRATAFAINWENVPQQVNLPNCGFGYVDNVGRARNLGLEVDGSMPIGRQIALTLSGGYVDARFRTRPGGDDDRRIPLVPRLTLVAGIELRQMRFALGEVSAEITYSYNSSFRRDLAPAQVTGRRSQDAPAYGRLSARVRLAIDTISLTLFGENLLDARPTLYDSIDLVPATQFPARQGTIQPRTIGLRLSYGATG